MTFDSAAFHAFLTTHGLSKDSPPSPEKWQSVLQVLQSQLNLTSTFGWKQALLDLQWPTFITDEQGVIHTWNQGCQQHLGYDQQVIGRPLRELLPTPLEGLRLDGLLKQVLHGEQLVGIELPFRFPDGRTLLTVCSVAPLHSLNGRSSGLVFTCAPLTGDQGNLVLARQSFYESLLNALPAPLTILNAQGQYIFCNEGAIRNPEIREWIIGKTDEEYMRHRGFNPDLLQRRQMHYQQAIQERRSVTFEEVFQNTDRGRVVQARTYTPVFDLDGQLNYMLGYGLEITELRRVEQELLVLNNELEARVQARTTQLEAANRQIQHDALHDRLTGLPNRALFSDRLEQAITRAAQPGGPQYAVLFLDTDRFKGINDSLGHPAGDALLQELAVRLRATLRASDTVARQGGDEFTVLMEPVVSEEQVLLVAERLGRELRQPIRLGREEVSVSVSMGVVLGDQAHHTAADVLRDADIAMYRAKHLGRGSAQVFRAEMREQTIRQGRLEQELRLALSRDELRVVYQPIVDLNSGLVSGFEALVRWQHPTRGLIGPGDFLHVAAEGGLTQELDRWVLHRACHDLNEWQREHPRSRELTLSVNFSAEHFSAPDAVAFLQDTLHETGFPAHLLHIEITEGVLLGQPQAIGATLREVQKLGVALHLDDFGTGYSSLSYLHHYPLNTLKIDRSFVASMLENTSSAELVRTIVAMTKNMNLDAVAEGIENTEQLHVLQELGCEYGQGYYFSPPLPLPQACQAAARLDATASGEPQDESN